MRQEIRNLNFSLLIAIAIQVVVRNILGLFSWAFAALRLQRCPDLAGAVSKGIGPRAGLPE